MIERVQILKTNPSSRSDPLTQGHQTSLKASPALLLLQGGLAAMVSHGQYFGFPQTNQLEQMKRSIDQSGGTLTITTW